MSNMSYCRFQNTLSDLRDCTAHLYEKLSEDEDRARINLAHQCINILKEIGVEVVRRGAESTIGTFCAEVQEQDDEEDESDD